MTEDNTCSPQTNVTAWDAHLHCEFASLDVEGALSAMVSAPYVNHIPTMAGGSGIDEVRDFYANHFVGQWPADTQILPISRTVGDDQIVDEMIISFTHDRKIDCLLPGVEPTGRTIEIPTVAIVRFVDGKVAREHLYWDQASVLIQAGLIDPAGLPAAGVEIAVKLKDPGRPSNRLIKRTS